MVCILVREDGRSARYHCRYRNHPIFKCSAKLNVTNNAEVTDLKDNWVVTV